MIKTFKVFLTINLILVITNCDSTGSGGKTTNNTNKEIKINGMSPSDYYTQFYKYKRNICETKENNEYYLSRGEIDLKIDFDNLPTYGEIKIFMKEDQTYDLEYNENKVSYRTSNGYGYDTVFSRVMKNRKWFITEAGKIVFEGIGIGIGVIYNKQPALSLSFTENINLETLKGKTEIVGLSHRLMLVEEYNSVCGNSDR